VNPEIMGMRLTAKIYADIIIVKNYADIYLNSSIPLFVKNKAAKKVDTIHNEIIIMVERNLNYVKKV
jgi:hypothetical protein